MQNALNVFTNLYMQNALNVFTNRTYVSNLKPICQNCNSSMGTKNMDEFMKSLK